mgnify:CR=1 FL=1
MYIPNFGALIINSLRKPVFDRYSQCRKLFQLWEYFLAAYIIYLTIARTVFSFTGIVLLGQTGLNTAAIQAGE